MKYDILLDNVAMLHVVLCVVGCRHDFAQRLRVVLARVVDVLATHLSRQANDIKDQAVWSLVKVLYCI